MSDLCPDLLDHLKVGMECQEKTDY
jgi:hypothetical protein